MAQDAEGLALAAEFPAVTEADWLAKVDATLKGAPIEKLVSKTYDGIPLKPLYTQADWDQQADQNGVPGAAPFTRGGAWRDPLGPPWHIRARISKVDPKGANKDALTDLVNGATALELLVDADAGGNEARGIAVQDVADLEAVLNDVMLDLAPVSFKAGPHAVAVATALLAVWEGRDVPADQAVASFNIDPIGTLASDGALPGSLRNVFEQLAVMIGYLDGKWDNARLIGVDAALHHSAGASEAQELAAALATAVAYLRALDDLGVDVAKAAKHLTFTFALDADVFLGITKLRAARRLWARVLEAADIAPLPMVIEAETASRMMTAYDPWVNMLRTTAAGFAGAIGGADSIAIRGYDEAQGADGEIGRRNARNIQIVLAEESHLGRVHDPAGGAGLFESLTDDLCESAWTLFQSIEARGGIVELIKSGDWAAELTRTAEARAVNVARRKEQLTGLSEFPNIFDEVAAVDEVVRPAQKSGAVSFDTPPEGVAAAIEKLQQGALLTDLTAALNTDAAETASVLVPRPVGAAFESLRKRSDAIKADTGTRPQVFLANLGPVSKHTARASFAKNFFEAGGVEAISTDGFDDMAALGNAFKSSGASLAVICGTDDQYASMGADAAAALKAAGAVQIYLAGKGGDNEAVLTGAGVTDYIFMGANLLDILSAAYDRLMEAK